MSRMSPELERLAALSQRVGKGPRSERRRVVRRAALGVVSVVVEVRGRPGTVSGTLRDLSRSGVGLNLPAELAVGDRFEFRAVVGMRLLRAECQVANCRPADGGMYVIGAQMVKADRLAGCADAGEEGLDRERVEEVERKLEAVVSAED